MSKRALVIDKLAAGDRRLSAMDLVGADLRGLDLSTVDLHEADLRQADLSGATLNGASLTGADLRGCDLTSAQLLRADLRHVDARKAIFRGAHVRHVDFFGADLRGADFVDADLLGAAIPFSCKGYRDVLHSGRAIHGLFAIFREARVDESEDEVSIRAAVDRLADQSTYVFSRQRRAMASESSPAADADDENDHT